MLKYWLSVPLIGITLLLAACSDGPSSSGGVTLYKGGGGPFTLTVENQGGHGAIEVCSNRLSGHCTNETRIAVAQGQCGAGVEGCTTTIIVPKSFAADGFKVVWSAGHTGTQQSYLATAYTCSPGSKGCTSSKATHSAIQDLEFLRMQRVIKFDANSDTATIGGTFSKDRRETVGGGANYCFVPTLIGYGNLMKNEVQGNAACQAAVNAYAVGCVAAEQGEPGHGAADAERFKCSAHFFSGALAAQGGKVASSCGEPVPLQEFCR